MPPIMFSVEEPENFDDRKLLDSYLKRCFYCSHNINEDSAYVYMYSDRAFCTSTCFLRQMRENDTKDFGKAIERLMKKKQHF
ncbi:hypothetical protein H6P81_014694 [Aristolochia fimbriata]|uniref:FLZ-type domain-containing protein n=1 Tax=Aristolochia fimbriata TaxID=158543 RepID=A0AAV7E4A2_ARIFI|nr:hypothetical protein H6P81_014694 [Aristolochia fimbriata]